MMAKNGATLSPALKGLIGAGAGVVLGGALAAMGVISLSAVPGVVAGIGLGTWFNARWRDRS